MYKKQLLQEVAHRSCFNLPSYTCIREGPDHAPRFKAIVNFNGHTFKSPDYCSTLRLAEHSAAEAALAPHILVISLSHFHYNDSVFIDSSAISWRHSACVCVLFSVIGAPGVPVKLIGLLNDHNAPVPVVKKIVVVIIPSFFHFYTPDLPLSTVRESYENGMMCVSTNLRAVSSFNINFIRRCHNVYV